MKITLIRKEETVVAQRTVKLETVLENMKSFRVEVDMSRRWTNCPVSFFRWNWARVKKYR